MQDITVQELKSKLQNKEHFVFIDVREPYEYQDFNLGAKLIPLGDFPNHINTLKAEHKDAEIVVHCRSGARSGVAKDLLVRAGFTNVRNLMGGVMAWYEKFGVAKV